MWIFYIIQGIPPDLAQAKVTPGDFKNFFSDQTNKRRKIFAMSDEPHLIKNVRNQLHNKKILKVHSN